LVANALLFYSFGLPSYVLVKIMEPTFFSRGDTKTPMKIAILCLINNVLFNYIFYIFNFGYVGIILSSVISSYLNLILLFTISIKKKHFYFKNDFIKKTALVIIPSIFMALSLHLLKNIFNNSQYFNKIIELIITISCGLLVYLVVSYFSGSLNIITKSNFLKRKNK
jgi:putative peptidoglycan lipid II flippase